MHEDIRVDIYVNWLLVCDNALFRLLCIKCISPLIFMACAIILEPKRSLFLLIKIEN